MSDRESYRRRSFAEATAPYAATGSAGPYTKLSISLPTPLVELVRGAAAEQGMSVSSMIAAAISLTLEHADQARLDAAIDAQNRENLDWAAAYQPIAADLLSRNEW